MRIIETPSRPTTGQVPFTRLLMVATVLLMSPAAAADAAQITFDNVLAAWGNAAPAGNVTFHDNGTLAPKARWGIDPPEPTLVGQGSGYDFDGVTSVTVDVPPSPSAVFELGTFRHVNQTIPVRNSITGIQLIVSADVSVDGTPVPGTMKTFIFDFEHLETPNAAEPCADGGTAFTPGVNVNGCADRVRFFYNALSDSFLVDGVLYSMALSGFVANDVQAREFWTVESLTNEAKLLGVVATRDSLVPEPVPEPATLLLVGGGLLTAAARRRRRT